MITEYTKQLRPRDLFSNKCSFGNIVKNLLTLVALTFSVCTYAQHYARIDLTADIQASSATATILDTHLVNAWGLSRSTGGPWWVSDNGTGLSTLYDMNGTIQNLVVSIPLPNNQGGRLHQPERSLTLALNSQFQREVLLVNQSLSL